MRAAGQDLAVVGDLHLDAGDRPTDRAELEMLEGVHSDHRRGLGEPVSFEDGQARRVEELRDVGVERSAAGDEEPDAPAGPLPELGEHQPVRPPAAERDTRRHRPCGEHVFDPGLAAPAAQRKIRRLRARAGRGGSSTRA